MKRIVWRAFVLASWIALIAGGIWSGKLSFGRDDAHPSTFPPGRISWTKEGPGTVAAVSPDDLDVPVRLVLRGDEASADWIEEKGAGLSVALLDGKRGEVLWEAGPGLDEVESVFMRNDEGYFVLAKGSWRAIKERRYELTARLKGADSDFLEAEPLLEIGTFREDRVQIPRKNRKPGLVFLFGGLGVFVHMFMSLARILVPLHPALPPEPSL